ncbi:MAG: hypothetical protein G01um101430_501 [Parcubacteria group bacterium Gr01-1014_30]|nr:MAG: hypothetical protein G01um101430_501 [Parcubacteria group bacterium Gr01-1014_30]
MEETNKKYAVSNNSSNRSWYNSWHGSAQHALIHWGIFLIIAALAWSIVQGRVWNWVFSLSAPEPIVRLVKSSAQLLLDPQTTAVTEGETFSVDITLDSGQGGVDGVDIYSLNYDPSLLQVVDSDPEKPGVQIVPGDVLPVNVYNSVDTKAGNIKFSQLTNPGTTFTGRGVLATIPFKALSAGIAYLTFDFVKGSTVDSNVAYAGKDRLDRVTEGVYTIIPK